MKCVAFGALFLIAGSICPTAGADGLPVAPGLWKSTSTILVSLDALEQASQEAVPDVRTVESCIANSAKILDAERLAGPGCVPSDVTRNGDGISFVLVCQRGDITLYGSMTALALADGTETRAQMILTGRSAEGREMQINANMVGERVGPCDE